jgi:hypothetical protein
MDVIRGLSARLWLGGLAAAGVVVAHQLAYVVAAPDPHARAELLRAAGHDHWSGVMAVAMGLLSISLLSFARRSLTEGAQRPWAGALVRLAPLQAGGFVVLEVAERLLVGAGVAGLWAEPAIVIGVALQILCAVATAAALGRAGRTLARWGSRRMPSGGDSPAPLRPVLRVAVARAGVLAGSGALRGPPGASH